MVMNYSPNKEERNKFPRICSNVKLFNILASATIGKGNIMRRKREYGRE